MTIEDQVKLDMQEMFARYRESGRGERNESFPSYSASDQEMHKQASLEFHPSRQTPYTIFCPCGFCIGFYKAWKLGAKFQTEHPEPKVQMRDPYFDHESRI